MKTIIAGSRTINNYQIVKQAIEESGFEVTEIVCGMARGVDMLGWKYAKDNSIPIKEFPADWGIGKFAGSLRNMDMARYSGHWCLYGMGNLGAQHICLK